MTLVVPQVGQEDNLNKWLNQVLTLRLFANNITPGLTDTESSYTEVTGGGYAAIVLEFAEFSVVAGSPSVALYSDFQDFSFTGAIGGTGVLYGYYITNADDVLIAAERFPIDDVPFTPINGSLIRVKPRITAANAD
jgi:hypothetical protein